jgi:hypothetical protein
MKLTPVGDGEGKSMEPDSTRPDTQGAGAVSFLADRGNASRPKLRSEWLEFRAAQTQPAYIFMRQLAGEFTSAQF